MVPWQTLILLTAGFFIREIYQKSKQTPADFDSGYKQAIKDIASVWNDGHERKLSSIEMLTKIHDYLQSKLNGGG